MLLSAKSVNSSSFSYSIFTTPELLYCCSHFRSNTTSRETGKYLYSCEQVEQLQAVPTCLYISSCSRLFLWGCCTLPESTHRRLVLRQSKAQVCLYSRITGGYEQSSRHRSL